MVVEQQTRQPTVDDLLNVRTPTDLAIGVDGTVAFSLHATVSEHGVSIPSDPWLLGADGGLTRLTDGNWGDRSPVWSPDGTRLGFLSDRLLHGHHLPYTMAVGGEPELAGTFRGSAEQLLWSSDGSRLLVLVADPWSYGLDWSAVAVTGSEPDPDPIVRRPDDAWRRLFLVDLASGEVDEVGPPGRSVWEVDWDGDATVVGLVSEGSGGSGWYRCTVARLDLGNRSATTLYEPTWQLEGLTLAPDGSRGAIVEGYSSDHGMLSGSVKIIDVATGGAADPWMGLETVGLVEWCDAATLWYARYDGTGTACGRIALDGSRGEVWAGAPFIGGDITKPACVVADGGDVVYTTHQAHGIAPELARFDHATREWERLTSFNEAIVDGTVFPDIRSLSWTAADGLRIDGLLLTPRGATGPFPLLALVHGGPSWCWNGYFSDSEPNATLLAGAGYAVLMPNPRGSNGRDHAFAQAVIDDPGGKDFADVMAGIDLCIERGIADPDRLGISGLSYGGYMTAWAVTQTDRFAAAVANSVIANWVSFHLTADIAAFDDFIIGDAWADPNGPYVRWSPVYHAAACTTPTLIIQGAMDRCTPVGQAEELFAAIARTGVDTELVVYPREGHVPFERAHARDAIVRTQAWFDRYLMPEGREDPIVKGDPRAVLVTGLFGTGKSSVAIEMADVLEKRELPYAVVDLDWLCWGWAGGAEGSEHRMMLANLVPVVANYLEAEVRYFIFARSVRTAAELEGLRSALSMPLVVVELTVPFSEIERRLAPDITTARQEDLRDAKAWLTAGDGVGLGDLSVPNDRPVRAVASDILHRLGWTEQDYHRGGGEE